jgi:hypothetical protein
MTEWTRFRRAAAVCALAVSPAAAAQAEDGRAVKRVYTNEDLARVSPHRGETGGESTPATPAVAESAADSAPAKGGGESYWRGEAARVRQRVEPWRDAAADLRAAIAARQAEPGVRPYTDAKVRALQRKLAGLEARIRDEEDRLEERARRARALPGWLR